MYSAFAALAVFTLASAYDLRERRIPPLLSYFLIFFGLAYHAAAGLVSQSPQPLINAVIVTAAGFCFAYALYRCGFWAGGDTKLFTGLAAAVPNYGGFAFFPFWAFALAVLLVLPAAGAWLAAAVLFSSKFRRTACFELKKSLKHVFTQGLLLFMFFYIVFGFSFRLADVAASFTFFLLASMLYAAGFAGLRVARQHVLRTKISVSELRQGMVLAQPAEAKGLRIRRLARGLTIEEIRLLRKSGVRAVVVTRSLPFTPILTAAVFALVLVFK